MSNGVDRSLIALEPKQFADYVTAIELAGGVVARLGDPGVGALIWTDYGDPAGLAAALAANPDLEWVQLPFAGVDAFSALIAQYASANLRFTSAKGAYSEPVAEHALMLALALGRAIPERVRAKSWGRKFAASLYDSNVVIVGAGGIAQELISLLAPFRAKVSVARNLALPLAGADRVVQFAELDTLLPEADFVFLAAALTAETTGLINAERLAQMKTSAYLINVARGGMVVSADLAAALRAGVIAGAGIDVTDPEPLPDGHYLWDTPNLIITPHTADTKPMVLRMFSRRVVENVRAYRGEGDWVGQVDPQLGY